MTTTLPRITTRVDLDTQELLTQAAAISGISSINSFVLSAAVEKAKKILEHEQALKLNKWNAEALIKALDSSAKPNPKLQKAAKHFDSKIQYR